jgi:hypothetical protein
MNIKKLDFELFFVVVFEDFVVFEDLFFIKIDF